MTESAELQKVIQTAYRSDTAAFFESPHCKIWGKDRTKGMIRPKLNHLQAKASAVSNKMRDLELPVRLIGLKPRQRGSTTWYSCEIYGALRREPTNACVIAGQYSQTSEIHEMLKTYSKSDTLDWGNTGEVNSKEGRWSNGSRLKFETAGDKLAGIASTLQALLCSEVARWAKLGVANAGEVLNNLLKCVPLLPNTIVVIESTAEGASGSYFERWQTAVDADKFLSGEVEVEPGTYVKIFSGWFEFDDSAIRLTEKQQQHIQQTMDSEEEFKGERELIELYGNIGEDGVMRLGITVKDFNVWEQLYWRRYAIREECQRDVSIFDRDFPHSPEAAFTKSGAMRFNSTGLAMQRKRLLKRAVPLYGVIEDAAGSKYSFRNTEKGEAKILLFEKPQVGCRYIVSVDPATGASQTGGSDPDNHGVFCMRAGFWDGKGQWNRPATAARIVQNMWDPDVLEKEIWRLARLYGGQTGAKICVEVNQDRGLIELLKLRGADLYAREIFNKREFKITSALGYSTNVKTREVLIDTLAAAIREWDTAGAGVDIWCPNAIEQCENFIVKPNGRSEAAENHHDDDVISMALGLELIEQAKPYVPERRTFGFPPELQQANRMGTGSAFS